MDIQFTTKAQDALGASVRIAAAKGNAQVEPLHILDSLLQQGDGIATALLDAVDGDAVVALRHSLRRLREHLNGNREFAREREAKPRG